MKILKLLVGAMVIPALLSGCIFVVAGAVGAVGGYAITRDTIQGEYDSRYGNAWKAAQDVCAILGTITFKDSPRGTMDALVNQAKVHVEITQLTPETIRVKVKARKGFFPNMDTAQTVFVKIVQRLK